MRRILQGLLLVLSFGAALGLPLSERTVFAAQHEEGAAAGGEEHADTAHAEGVPLDFKGDLALWSLVTFLIFLAVLSKFAWGPLVAGLDKRESRIRQDIADAETARIKAEQMLAEHQTKLDRVQEEVRGILAEARRDADVAKQNIVAEAQREARATLDRSLAEINRAKEQAQKELFDQATELIAQSTEHVLGRSLTGEDQDRLIEEALREFASSGAQGA